MTRTSSYVNSRISNVYESLQTTLQLDKIERIIIQEHVSSYKNMWVAYHVHSCVENIHQYTLIELTDGKNKLVLLYSQFLHKRSSMMKIYINDALITHVIFVVSARPSENIGIFLNSQHALHSWHKQKYHYRYIITSSDMLKSSVTFHKVIYKPEIRSDTKYFSHSNKKEGAFCNNNRPTQKYLNATNLSIMMRLSGH